MTHMMNVLWVRDTATTPTQGQGNTSAEFSAEETGVGITSC